MTSQCHTQKARHSAGLLAARKLPKLIIFQVWCIHGHEYWGDGLSNVTPCNLVNNRALQEPDTSTLHAETAGNTVLLTSLEVKVAQSVRWDIPHTWFDFQKDQEVSSAYRSDRLWATRPFVGSCSGVRSQPVIMSHLCYWTRHITSHHSTAHRHINCRTLLLLIFLLQ
jgi:hypothetical protein